LTQTGHFWVGRDDGILSLVEPTSQSLGSSFEEDVSSNVSRAISTYQDMPMESEDLDGDLGMLGISPAKDNPGYVTVWPD